MTTKPKPVTLFGVEMKKDGTGYRIGLALLLTRKVNGKRVWCGYHSKWPILLTKDYPTAHAAARALERKIVAAHRRLGKLIEGKK